MKIREIVTIVMVSLILSLVIYNCARPDVPQEKIPEYRFNLGCVEDLRYDTIGGGYEITYFVDSLDNTIKVSTSLIEGDILKVMLDYYDVYISDLNFDKIDSLEKYVEKVSELKYVDNCVYKGYIWVCNIEQ